MPELSLGELRSAAGCLESVFLSFLHTRVACEESGLFEGGAEFRIGLQESSCNSVADGARLTGEAAAVYAADYVELADGVRDAERLIDDKLHSVESEIIVDIASVNCHDACPWNKANAGN